MFRSYTLGIGTIISMLPQITLLANMQQYNKWTKKYDFMSYRPGTRLKDKEY